MDVAIGNGDEENTVDLEFIKRAGLEGEVMPLECSDKPKVKSKVHGRMEMVVTATATLDTSSFAFAFELGSGSRSDWESDKSESLDGPVIENADSANMQVQRRVKTRMWFWVTDLKSPFDVVLGADWEKKCCISWRGFETE